MENALEVSHKDCSPSLHARVKWGIFIVNYLVGVLEVKAMEVYGLFKTKVLQKFLTLVQTQTPSICQIYHLTVSPNL